LNCVFRNLKTFLKQVSCLLSDVKRPKTLRDQTKSDDDINNFLCKTK